VRRFRPSAVFVALGFVAILGYVGGCASTSQEVASTAAKELPPKALLSLKDLQPKLVKPQNPPHVYDNEALPAELAERIATAEKFISNGNYDEAIESLTQMQELAGQEISPAISRNLALAYFEKNDIPNAVKNIEDTLSIAPDDLELNLLGAKLHSKQEQAEKALVALRKAMLCSEAVSSNLRAAQTLGMLAELLNRQGYWTAANECYAKLEGWIDLAGRNYSEDKRLWSFVLKPGELMALRGSLLMRLQRPAEASELFERAYRRNRTNISTARMLIDSLIESRNFERAEKLVIEISSEPIMGNFASAMAWKLCNVSADPAMPMRIWSSFLKKNKASESLGITLALAAEQNGATAESSEILNSILREMPGNVRAGRLMALSYVKAGRLLKAIELLANIISSGESSVVAVQNVLEEFAFDFDKEAMSQLAEDVETNSAAQPWNLYFLVGELARYRDNTTLAERQLKKCIKANDKFFPAYNSLLDIYLIGMERDELKGLLEQIEKVAVETYFLDFSKGKLAYMRGMFGEAVQNLNKSYQKKNEHIPTLLLLSDAYAQLGKAKESMQALLSAFKTDPDVQKTYRALFDRYLISDKIDQAIIAAKKLRQRHPNSLAANLMLIEAYLVSGKPNEAQKGIDALKARAAKNPNIELLEMRVSLGYPVNIDDEELFARTVKRLVSITHEYPNNLSAKQFLAALIIKFKDKSADVWQQLYQETPYEDITKAYVSALERSGQRDKAVEILKEFLNSNPDKFWAKRAVVDLLQQEHPLEAVALLEDWLSKDQGESGSNWYRLKLLNLYLKTNDYQKAHELIDDWIAQKPSEAILNNLRAQKLQVFGKQEKFDAAIEYAQGWIKDSPNSQVPREIIIGLLTDAQAYKKAQQLIDEWIADSDKDTADAYRSLKIYILGRSGEIDKAESFVLDRIKTQPWDLMLRQSLIGVLIDAQQYDRAVKLLDSWTDLKTPTTATSQTTQPSSLEEVANWSSITAVNILLIQGNNSDALERVDEYIRLKGNNAEAHNLRASCLSELGRKDEALKALEKALSLAPDDPGINNNLGYFLAEMGINLERAERLIRKALTDRPDELSFQDSLGWVFYKQGKFRESARLFGRITDKIQLGHPGIAIMLDHAGDAYYRLGETQKAIELWEKALKQTEKEKLKDSEFRRVETETPGKIKALQEGKTPAVAPLGEDIEDRK